MPPPASSPLRDKAFLSPLNYDDDASSIHSERSDQDTDSEDDEVLMGARSSADIRQHDRGVLLEEEERDRLLEESRRRGRRGSALAMVEPFKKLFSKSYTELPGTGSTADLVGEKGSKRRERKKKRREKQSEKKSERRERRQRKRDRLTDNAAHGEDGELMYEMEEGGMKQGSVTGDSSETEGSDELDRRGLRGLLDEKAQKKRRWRRWCFIHLLILVGFAILVLVAWKLSLKQKGKSPVPKVLSNGTALFAPTTILVSLDGFRADFLRRGLTPRLNAFVEEGVSPLYMLPSFPSVTFPNHFTLATGLYPEAHGIVGNTFWDVDLKEEFYYTHPDAMQPKWWNGEPLWVTAEKEGIRTAVHMWPGSEAHIMATEPSFLDAYNGNEPLPNKVSRILELLDKPGMEHEEVEAKDMRPQLVLSYVPNVDADGHLYGPNSTEIRKTITDVDTMLDNLFKGLEARNLTKIVNVVVVSDHGMATTDATRLLQLEDLVDTSLIEHTDGWPLYGLRPKDPSQLQSIYDGLAAKAATNPNFDVYLRDKNMPERYHFSKNERIAPLWIVPKTGWAIVKKEELVVEEAKAKGTVYHPRGLHGYDHEHPLMRAIFIARGPAFPHAGNSRVEPFQNIEVYNIVCDSLGLLPKPNNGTIRLPFKTIGLHSPDTHLDEPVDPVPPNLSTNTTDVGADAIISISPIEASSAADPLLKPPHIVGVDIPKDKAMETPAAGDVPGDVNVDRPTVGDESTSKLDDKTISFLDWFQDKLNEFKGWFHDTVAQGKADAEKGS